MPQPGPKITALSPAFGRDQGKRHRYELSLCFEQLGLSENRSFPGQKALEGLQHRKQDLFGSSMFFFLN